MDLLGMWDEHNQKVAERQNEVAGGTWNEWAERQDVPGPAWLWFVSGLPWVGLIALPVLVVITWRHRRRRRAEQAAAED